MFERRSDVHVVVRRQIPKLDEQSNVIRIYLDSGAIDDAVESESTTVKVIAFEAERTKRGRFSWLVSKKPILVWA